MYCNIIVDTQAMRIFVKTLTGKPPYYLEVEAATLILDIVKKCSDLDGYDVNSFDVDALKLICNGKYLDKSLTIGDYSNITEGSTIHYALCLRGD